MTDQQAPTPIVPHGLTHEAISTAFRDVQDTICNFLIKETGEVYKEDLWKYEKGEGGGITRVWEGGHYLEKAGVNFSFIKGNDLPIQAVEMFKIAPGTPYTATGVSLVLHPRNPHVPTIHFNIRFFEAGDKWWFGGGVDLTPYYPRLDDVIEFHGLLRTHCEEHGQSYEKLKSVCDTYFFIKHRNETRGVGGLFVDSMGGDGRKALNFMVGLGMLFPRLWTRSLSHKDEPYTSEQRSFQLYRRSRYVEFNLVQDRGTKFGLSSNGRIESILMSMPMEAHWRYNWKPAPGTVEEKFCTNYLKAQDWLGLTAQQRLDLKLPLTASPAASARSTAASTTPPRVAVPSETQSRCPATVFLLPVVFAVGAAVGWLAAKRR